MDDLYQHAIVCAACEPQFIYTHPALQPNKTGNAGFAAKHIYDIASLCSQHSRCGADCLKKEGVSSCGRAGGPHLPGVAPPPLWAAAPPAACTARDASQSK